MHLNDKSTKLSRLAKNPFEITHVRSSTWFPDIFIACSLLSQCNLASFQPPTPDLYKAGRKDFTFQGIIQLKIIATPCWRILNPPLPQSRVREKNNGEKSCERECCGREQNERIKHGFQFHLFSQKEIQCQYFPKFYAP